MKEGGRERESLRLLAAHIWSRSITIASSHMPPSPPTCTLHWLQCYPTVGGVCGVNTKCSRSIDVVAEQQHSDCAVPWYRYRTELVGDL